MTFTTKMSLCLVAAAACAGVAQPAFGAPAGEPVERVVRADDLDLTAANDRDRLRRRIRSAAYYVCAVGGDGPTPAPATVEEGCFRTAVADGFQQMDALTRRGHVEVLASIKIGPKGQGR